MPRSVSVSIALEAVGICCQEQSYVVRGSPPVSGSMLRLVVADEKPKGTLLDLQNLACDFIHFCLIRGEPSKGEAMVTYSVEKLVVKDA